MTKTQATYTLQAFDDLADILTDQLDQYWEDTVMWDTINRARIHVLDGRAECATLYKRLLIEGD